MPKLAAIGSAIAGILVPAVSTGLTWAVEADSSLLSTMANLGGMGILAAVLFYLHLFGLRQQEKERDEARKERDLMRLTVERNNAVINAIADRVKVPEQIRNPDPILLPGEMNRLQNPLGGR